MKKISKEVWFIIGILIFIFVLEWLTNYISEEAVKTIGKELVDIEEKLEKIEEIDNKVVNDKIKKLKDDWFEKERVISIFAEHNELEKISISIALLEENTKNEEYKEALSKLTEAKFWLEHFKDKDSLVLKNIF